MWSDGSRVRIAIFTHDAYGLGHVQRSIRIARALAERAPGAAILLMTGSPAKDMVERLPPNADYLKIPTIVFSDSQGLGPPVLPLGQSDLAFLREKLIEQTILTFAPSVFLVDNFPLGARGELLPALHGMRRLSGRSILGLRDVVDPPEKLQYEWGRQGMHEILDRYYDRILVYGVPEVIDAAEACALSPHLAERLHYCGYVAPDISPLRARSDVRAELGLDGPLLVATVGGGGDGFPVIEAFIRALPLLPDASAVVITGQFMDPAERAELRELASGRPGVMILDHVRDLPSYLAAADGVVAMCGYNTATEILAVRARAIVIPRTWRSGRHRDRAEASEDPEQLLRARALAKLGLVDLLEPSELDPERLAERIRSMLDRPRAELEHRVDLRGAARVAEQVLAVAQQ